MNPTKESVREVVYGDFGIYDSCKSDGWHGDIEAILAEYETPRQSTGKGSPKNTFDYTIK
jgi:hypothetical protein